MPALRLLLTGPPRSPLRGRAIARALAWEADHRGHAPSLWLAPSPLARDQIARDLALTGLGADDDDSASSPAPRVWCWDQVWGEIHRASALATRPTTIGPVEPPPARLSPAGTRAALAEAIQRARETEVLGPLVAAIEQPGFRRRLLARFAAWIAAEADPTAPPAGPSAVERAQWSLYRLFREVLRDIRAVTPEGLAAWASNRLVDDPPPGWRDLGSTLVVAVEPVAPTRAEARALDLCRRRAGGMIATLPHDPEPALAELFAPVAHERSTWLDAGFAEEPIEPDPATPEGLIELDRELFRADAHRRPAFAAVTGLQVLGGPQGEGSALLVARRVREALDRGAAPDDVLILVPRADEDAALIRATLADWGLPVDPGPARRPASIPAVAALRLAIRLPGLRWDVATVTRLVRHGALDWGRLGLADAARRFEAARAIASTRVYRDLGRLRKALDRARDATERNSYRWSVQTLARTTVDRLADRIEPLALRPAPFRAHLDRLRALADQLGLDADALGPLWDAIEDHAWVLDQVGPAIAAQAVRWPDFVDRVEAIIADAEPSPAEPSRSVGVVRVEPVAAALGARASVVILANLAEGTFPDPRAVPLAPTPAAEPTPLLDAGTDPTPVAVAEAEADPTDLGFGREMLRFARAVGAADHELTLAYPTTDSNGEGLLPAGFLDEILRRLDPVAAPAAVEAHGRFDPVLRGHEGLARSLGDARVLAVARAVAGDFGPLRNLATDPAHAPSLRGTAEAFRVGHARRERGDFNAHDGWLMDPEAIAKVAADFGADHPFSPSQLESFAACPFQFFGRYVLGLKPIEGAEELAEDYAERGRLIHGFLEKIHETMVAEGTADLAARLPFLIDIEMNARLEDYNADLPPGEYDVATVLREIEDRRNARVLRRYEAQFRAYAAKVGAGAVPFQFEVKFGLQEKDPASLDYLVLGEGDGAIRVQGVIDRIDLVAGPSGAKFRIIDYKTGSNPSANEVRTGLASQLPLYALAVERLVRPEGDPEFADAGYWSLPRHGYKGVNLGEWDGYRERLIGFVLGMVGELRRGVFPVHSQDKKCHQRCDFGAACRYGEVRQARKSWADRPGLEVIQ